MLPLRSEVHRAMILALLTGCGGAADSGGASSDTLTGAQSASITDGTYTIRTAVSGKCLDVAGASTEDGAKVQEWSCNGTGAQRFEVTRLADGAYQIINAHSRKSLDIYERSTQPNAPLQQWAYGGGANQQFQLVDRGGGQISIHPRHSNMALDVYFGSTADGTPIVQYPWSGRSNQRWVLQREDAAPCKRGIASNIAPGPAFASSITWRYNWSLNPAGADVGIEFAPMVWGRGSLGKPIPARSRYLLGFNEPNFRPPQSDLSPQEAAARWPEVEAQARATGAQLVSPAVNFCGPPERCHRTDPYQYLQEFFDACKGCRVDSIAVHWYNCDLASLKDYLEPGGRLPGFEQFHRPIWLTEFSCNEKASPAQQERFMREAIPYLEGNPAVFRYSWFSAAPIPSAELINKDGTPTPLGRVYIDLPQRCR